MTTVSTSTVSSGAGSQRGGRMRQTSSSFNPVYNSISCSGVVEPSSISVYEELPQDHLQHIPEKSVPADPPPSRFIPSFSAGRTTTLNTMYASTGGGQGHHSFSLSGQVYKYDRPPDHVYKDKQSGCVCTCEAAILVMALLVVLLAGAATIMSLLLWLKVIPVQNLQATSQSMSVSGDCSCANNSMIVAAQAQIDNFMTLLAQVRSVQVKLDSLANEDTTSIRSQFNLSNHQLEEAAQTLQSNVTRSLPSSFNSTANFSSQPGCTNDVRTVCSIAADLTGPCSGGIEQFVNSPTSQRPGLLTEFSCYLDPEEDHGPVNGSTYVQVFGGAAEGVYTPAQVQDKFLVVTCICFIFEPYPASVRCMRSADRCPLTVANVPATFES